MDKKRVVAVCNAIAGICFTLLCFGNFISGNVWMGLLFEVLAGSQIIFAGINSGFLK